MDLAGDALEHAAGSPTSVFSTGAMICFVSTASTNSSNQARNASTGDLLSAKVRSAAASFSISER